MVAGGFGEMHGRERSTMARELWLLRHAKSAWDSGATCDFDRPLSPRGQYEAARLGRWMNSSGLRPDLVLSSSARRAYETALSVSAALGLDPAAIEFRGSLYEASAAALHQALHALPAASQHVLLVGHNPGLEVLLEQLCGELVAQRRDDKLMTTACFARVEMTLPWASCVPGCGRLLTLLRARDLPDG
jgi:phosphohistidine phosphatase